MTRRGLINSTIILTILLLLLLLALLALLIPTGKDSRLGTLSATEKPGLQILTIPDELIHNDDRIEAQYEMAQITDNPPQSREKSQQYNLPDIDLNCWMYRLVNRDNPLDDAFSVELSSMPGGQQFDSRAADALLELYVAASEQNLNIILNSGYRTIAHQRMLYENRLSVQLSSGMSDEEAKRTTLQIVAYPGTSEHNLGLAIDILDRDYSIAPVTAAFSETELGKWLKEHCADYGFILRYPEDKTDITGIQFEPWHYRYVGTDAAKYIMDNRLCLEEFLELYF